MNLDVVRKLIDLVESSAVDEVEVRTWWGRRIRVTRRVPGREVVVSTAEAAPVVAPVAAAEPAAGQPPAAAPDPAPAAEEADSGLIEITSPMVGTFYVSPSPDSDPFVGVGSRVTPETVVCIVEAMKIFNEIEAEVAGEIVECLVDNGTPIEHGQALYRVRPR